MNDLKVHQKMIGTDINQFSKILANITNNFNQEINEKQIRREMKFQRDCNSIIYL